MLLFHRSTQCEATHFCAEPIYALWCGVVCHAVLCCVLQSTDAELLGFGEGEDDDSELDDDDDESDDEQPAAAAAAAAAAGAKGAQGWRCGRGVQHVGRDINGTTGRREGELGWPASTSASSVKRQALTGRGVQEGWGVMCQTQQQQQQQQQQQWQLQSSTVGDVLFRMHPP